MKGVREPLVGSALYGSRWEVRPVARPALPCPDVASWKASAFSPPWACDHPDRGAQRPADDALGAPSLCLQFLISRLQNEISEKILEFIKDLHFKYNC